jgi:SulP family sulfate permease
VPHQSLERTFARIERQAHQEQVHHVLLRLKRVRHPDVVSLEHLEHFLKHAEAAGITVWLAGLQPDLLEAFGRLRFSAWLAQERIFAQGADEDSATLAAIRHIRAALPQLKAVASNKLFYLV